MWIAVVSSVLAGVALLVAFPPYGLWWSAPVGVALLAVATHRRSLRAGAALGGVTGLVFFVPLLSFTGLQVGWWPWILLASLEALYLALLGAAGALTSSLVERRRWLWPLLAGALWVAEEALRSRTPFGGFPWGRLAFSQGNAPTGPVAALGGAPLVTFVVAAAGGLLALAASRPLGRPLRERRSAWVQSTAALSLAAVVMLAGLALPTSRANGRSVVVAVVQGNVPRMGLDFNAQRRAVLDNHVTATLALANDVRAGLRARPDVVIWPENSSDIDPYANPDAARRITTAAEAVGVPILVGAVLSGPDAGTVRNAGIVWNPDGGTTATYVKRHPVPFGEYVPMRSWIRRVTTLVDRVRADFVAGDTPGVLPVGGVTVGDVICFEVAYDSIVRDTVTGGAQLLVVQTNNATFNNAQAQQQLAMVRLRAIEHGRPAVMASTVGVSAVVGTDGAVGGATRMNTAATIVRELRLGTATTLATRLGVVPEAVLTLGALAAIMLGVRLRRHAIQSTAPTATSRMRTRGAWPGKDRRSPPPVPRDGAAAR